ncbi:MAG: Gfo/Idh/MocA family oxidoreductase [Anaerolineales bacterium]|jgi:myo-inositol 2-dehydrogenase/D-chiro-inositol 1-dehydrogenase
MEVNIEQTIGFGIIGSGFMARTYAECLRKYAQGGQLKAVFGGSGASQLAVDYSITCEETLANLLNRDDLQAVIITTPETVHRQQTEQAAAAGKHILVEKPMAPDAAQCEVMIDSCAHAGVKLMVVQSQRFRGAHQHLRQLLNEGRIGRIHQIRHWLLHPLKQAEYLTQTRPFYRDPDGGGLFMGYTVHSFDLIRWLAGGDAVSVFANLHSYGDHKLPDLSMMAQVIFDNVVVAQLWWSAELPGITFPGSRFRTQLVGSHGLIDCDGYGSLQVATEHGWETTWEQPPFDLEDPQDPVRLEAYSEMIQEFINALRDDRLPLVTGTDGRAAVELCQAALRSARSGKVVKLQTHK